MRILLTILISIVSLSVFANGDAPKEFCGFHHIENTYEHYFDVEYGDATPGRYELTAADQIAARVVNRLENGVGYCIQGNLKTMSDGKTTIEFITIMSDWKHGQ